MRIDILTLFPGIFTGPLDESILKRARESGRLDVRVHDLRQWCLGKHREADDAPYGGGGGMVMMVEPVDLALAAITARDASAGVSPAFSIDAAAVLRSSSPTPNAGGKPALPAELRAGGTPALPAEPGSNEDVAASRAHIIFMTPQGAPLDHNKAVELAQRPWLVFLCGRYEGIDERAIEMWADEEISIGDYVVTGGELPALVTIDALARHIPGVLGNETSAAAESFVDGLLDYPHYTRPVDYKGLKVPPILLSGNHGAVKKWRREEALRRTRDRRPDLSGKIPDKSG